MAFMFDFFKGQREAHDCSLGCDWKVRYGFASFRFVSSRKKKGSIIFIVFIVSVISSLDGKKTALGKYSRFELRFDFVENVPSYPVWMARNEIGKVV